MEAIKVITMNVSKIMSKLTQFGALNARILWVSLAGLTSSAAHAVNDLPGGPAVRQYNLHPAVTKVAEDQGWLHWYMLAICLAIFVAVFGVMFYSIIKHRKSVGHKPANFHVKHSSTPRRTCTRPAKPRC